VGADPREDQQVSPSVVVLSVQKGTVVSDTGSIEQTSTAGGLAARVGPPTAVSLLAGNRRPDQRLHGRAGHQEDRAHQVLLGVREDLLSVIETRWLPASLVRHRLRPGGCETRAYQKKYLVKKVTFTECPTTKCVPAPGCDTGRAASCTAARRSCCSGGRSYSGQAAASEVALGWRHLVTWAMTRAPASNVP